VTESTKWEFNENKSPSAVNIHEIIKEANENVQDLEFD
jgi:hypothetical protein